MKTPSSFLVLALASISSAQGAIVAGGEYGRKPLVTSSKLQQELHSPNLVKHAKQLVNFSKLSNGTRAFGTLGHNATLSYIKNLLDRTNFYDTVYQTFPYLYSDGSATFSASGTNYSTSWFTYGPAGDVTAPLVIVNNLGCEAADFPATVVGKIALIKRGTCQFGLKVALAGAASAAGAIIYNNAPDDIGGGTLGQASRPDIGPYVPAGAISGSDGQALVAAISGGSEIVGHLRVVAVNENRTTSNIIATTKTGDKQNIVMAGAHTDSVPAGPGINDNGSGTISLLEIALQLSRFSVNNTVRFGWWTAEEFGLVGSEHYVTNLSEEEKQEVALYLNFDMIASPNAGYFIYDGDGSVFNKTGPPGSDHIEKTFEEYFVGAKIKSAATAFDGRSDYGPFLDAGIPAGGLDTGAEGIMTAEEAQWWDGQAGVAYDKCYHQACDSIDNLNVPAWIVNTKGAAHGIATYALSLKGIPRPRAPAHKLQATKLPYNQCRHPACGQIVLA